MNRVHRLLVAGLLVLSGLALIPAIGFPAEHFRWQQFAGLYEPQPTLTVNHPRGHRDSVFAVRGEHFPPNGVVQVRVNGRPLGSAQADSQGRVQFQLTTDDADQGYYMLAVNQISGASFWIDNAAPRWSAEGTGASFAVPDASALTVFRYLPFIQR